MVTVVNYALRKTSEGREFYVLILQGGLSLVQSRQTGNFYATLKQCSIPSTFDEATAKQMIGERVPGSVADWSQKYSMFHHEFRDAQSESFLLPGLDVDGLKCCNLQ